MYKLLYPVLAEIMDCFDVNPKCSCSYYGFKFIKWKKNYVISFFLEREFKLGLKVLLGIKC